MSGTGEEDQVEIVFFDEPVEMHPCEGLAGIGAPVAEQAVLDVLRLERLSHKRVLREIDHADAEVVAGSPIGVHLVQLFFGED